MEFIAYMEQNQPAVIWLAFGVVMFAVELIGPGIGLMFAGCGALTVGLLLNFSLLPPDSLLLHTVVFLMSTGLWTAVLWQPIKKFRIGQKKESYHNIVGESAVVGKKGLDKMRGGEVVWSGTVMKAKLAKNSSRDRLEEGTPVTIKNVEGTTFTVDVVD